MQLSILLIVIPPYTRIYEHKHFEFGTQPNTVISREYSVTSRRTTEPYYPINNAKNLTLLKKYQLLSQGKNDIIFGGRLAEYHYYDMHQVIASALNKSKAELRII
ncbi:MAG: UDP-galactopyranose mutase [Mucilaginibacter sp.]|nr:UDP-galactopyranose mutase [Mucilaginibacter sp.]